jgi:hypothetical protein
LPWLDLNPRTLGPVATISVILCSFTKLCTWKFIGNIQTQRNCFLNFCSYHLYLNSLVLADSIFPRCLNLKCLAATFS